LKICFSDINLVTDIWIITQLHHIRASHLDGTSLYQNLLFNTLRFYQASTKGLSLAYKVVNARPEASCGNIYRFNYENFHGTLKRYSSLGVQNT
jgi:hypothetical protein